MIRRHTRLRETDDLAMWGAPAIKQQPPISVSSISMKVRLTMLRNHLYICYEVMILLSFQITEQKALPSLRHLQAVRFRHTPSHI